jgi:hypothetical protein
MKKSFLIIFLAFFSVTFVFAQNGQKGDRKGKGLEKIQAWEKAKLIEILNLNEENSIRFFARRNEHQNKIKEILDQKDQLADKMEAEFKEGTKVSNSVYNEQINSFIEFENKIHKERENYIRSLNDILTPEQIAKLAVFEQKFRKEIKQRMLHGKGN